MESLAEQAGHVLSNEPDNPKGINMRPFISLMLVLGLTVMASPASAVMYKWTDQDGTVQYGQFPPQGVEAEEITPGRPPRSQSAPEPSPQERLQELEKAQEKQGEQAAEQAALQHQAEQRKKDCEISRDNLKSLTTGGRHRVRMPDGTVTYLSEEDRQQRIIEAKKRIIKHCD